MFIVTYLNRAYFEYLDIFGAHETNCSMLGNYYRPRMRFSRWAMLHVNH